MQLSVIIVNYNVRHFLCHCLLSVQKATEGMAAEILVVDNNSADGSREYLPTRFPAVKFLWLDQNVGFSAANNKGLALAGGTYVLFLNPDTLLGEDSLRELLAYYAQADCPGALGVKMIDGSGAYLPESKRGYPSPFTSLYKMSGLARRFPRSKLFARYYLGHLSPATSHAIDVLSGACFLSERKLVQDLGGFDSTYFMYGEDIDLSKRIQLAGRTNYYFAGTTILHFKGESTQKMSAPHLKYFYGAMQKFVNRYHSPVEAALYGFVIKAVLATRLFKLKQRKELPANSPAKKNYSPAYCLTYANDHDQIRHRLATGFDSPEFIAELDNRLPAGATIIFDSNSVPYREAFGKMEAFTGQYNFLFYAREAEAVIGSSDKNTQGDVILLSDK